MAYFLRQTKKNKGIYLQMYDAYWDKDKIQPRSKYVEAFGYVDYLKSDSIPDPIEYYKNYVTEIERKRKAALNDETQTRVFDTQVEKNVDYFILDVLFNELDVKPVIDILASDKKFQFDLHQSFS